MITSLGGDDEDITGIMYCGVDRVCCAHVMTIRDRQSLKEQLLIQTKRQFYSLMVVTVAEILHSLTDLVGVVGEVINVSHICDSMKQSISGTRPIIQCS